MDDSPRDLRVASWVRGIFIGVLIVLYGWFVKAPEGSLTQTFVIGAGVQLLIILVRRFVPADSAPQAQYIFEMIADAVTVLLFALGVFGGIARFPQEL